VRGPGRRERASTLRSTARLYLDFLSTPILLHRLPRRDASSIFIICVSIEQWAHQVVLRADCVKILLAAPAILPLRYPITRLIADFDVIFVGYGSPNPQLVLSKVLVHDRRHQRYWRLFPVIFGGRTPR
jgi:hypothetical protein